MFFRHVWNARQKEDSNTFAALIPTRGNHSKSGGNRTTMRNFTATGIMFIVVLLVVWCGCNKKDNATNPTGGTTSGTATLTLNGAGFSNQTFSFAGVVGGFSASDNLTGIVGTVASATDTTTLMIVFPGISTGTYQFSDTVGVVIVHSTASSSRFFANGPANGQIAVTTYGGVGGSIAGSFSGRLYEFSLSAFDSVTVSNGSFNAFRVPND